MTTTTETSPLPAALLARIDEALATRAEVEAARVAYEDHSEITRSAYQSVVEKHRAARAALVAECRALVADRERLEWVWRNGFLHGGEGRPCFLRTATLDEMREKIDAERES